MFQPPWSCSLTSQAWSAGCHPCRRKTSETVTHLKFVRGLFDGDCSFLWYVFIMYAFFTCKCISKFLDLDGLVKFPWPWNMYLYSSMKKHGMIAPWDDSSHSPQVWRGKAEPFWPTVCCRSLSLAPIFFNTGNAVEKGGCIVRFDSSMDRHKSRLQWLVADHEACIA